MENITVVECKGAKTVSKSRNNLSSERWKFEQEPKDGHSEMEGI